MLEHKPLLDQSPSTEQNGLGMAFQAPEINLIPFIDVLLVILIFLMISTTFTQYQELSITLPSVAGESGSPNLKEIRVAVSKDGKYALNGNLVDAATLGQKMELMKNQAAQISEANANALRVVISAEASHQSVMQVLEIASHSGLNNIAFATQDTQPTQKKK